MVLNDPVIIAEVRICESSVTKLASTPYSATTSTTMLAMSLELAAWLSHDTIMSSISRMCLRVMLDVLCHNIRVLTHDHCICVGGTFLKFHCLNTLRSTQCKCTIVAMHLVWIVEPIVGIALDSDGFLHPCLVKYAVKQCVVESVSVLKVIW